jgi:hypothetical protein
MLSPTVATSPIRTAARRASAMRGNRKNVMMETPHCWMSDPASERISTLAMGRFQQRQAFFTHFCNIGRPTIMGACAGAGRQGDIWDADIDRRR